MKKIYAVLALSLCVGGSLFALDEAETPSQAVILPVAGDQRTARIRADFEQGKFNSLFDSLEGEYGELQKNGRIEEFAEMRRVPEAGEQLKELASRFDKMASLLLLERNAELKALCEGHQNEIASLRIQSVTSPLDERQKEAIRTLASLRFKTPDQAANPDERALIEIDLAYEFKSLHLDQSDSADLVEKQIALGMEKMKKMEQVSQSFTDSVLKETVSIAAQGFDACQSKSLDMRELLAAAKKPSCDLDRNIGSVLTGYKAKKDDLYQREFLAKLQS